MIADESDNLLKLFKDEKSFYVFCLTRVDGKKRNCVIGITDEMYENKELAKKWYHTVIKGIGHISDDDTDAKEAFLTLRSLYETMIDVEDEDA